MNDYKRFRIIETNVRDKQNFMIQWNDKWFFGLFGIWHDKFICKDLDECKKVIDRLIQKKELKRKNIQI